MIFLTEQERKVALFVALVFFSGMVIRSAAFFFPSQTRALAILDDDSFRPPVDINRASFDELVAVPRIGAFTARKIIERREKVPFRDLDDLRGLVGMREENFQKMKRFLKVSRKGRS